VLLLGLSIWCCQDMPKSASTGLKCLAAFWMVAGHEFIVLYPKLSAKIALKFVHKNRLETHTSCVYNRMK
ncbi:MAG: hypothetical protein IKL38_09490, partial [Firmicutes bacterium]|nr:hypothetical protein [Bacillota bacterium]